MANSISFSLSIYREDAVQAAVLAYTSLADFTVVSNSSDVIVEVANINPSFESVLLDAFCNHVLFETIVRHRNEFGGESG